MREKRQREEKKRRKKKEEKKRCRVGKLKEGEGKKTREESEWYNGQAKKAIPFVFVQSFHKQTSEEGQQ